MSQYGGRMQLGATVVSCSLILLFESPHPAVKQAGTLTLLLLPRSRCLVMHQKLLCIGDGIPNSVLFVLYSIVRFSIRRTVGWEIIQRLYVYFAVT